MAMEEFAWSLPPMELSRENENEPLGNIHHKQLKNLFYYARKTRKMPKFISPENLERLKKYWESWEFQKLGPSLHTCRSIPMTKWC